MTEKNIFAVVAILSLVVFTATAGTYDRTCPEPAVIFDESGDMTAPEVTNKVNPKYPDETRKEGVSGTVVLDAVINSAGGVDGVSVLEDPDPRLSAAAADAVRQWQFEPARDASGKPVDVCFVLTVKFHLK